MPRASQRKLHGEIAKSDFGSKNSVQGHFMSNYKAGNKKESRNDRVESQPTDFESRNGIDSIILAKGFHHLTN